jgi:DegV family protein with EDD domain
MKIHELASQGKRFASVIAETERFIESLTTLFVVEDLENLRKNGRLSHLQSVITGVLKIRLILGGERDGTIGIRGKALTTGSALSKMAELVRQKCGDVGALKRPLVITYCNCRERAEQVKKMVFSACPFQRVELCRAGGISTVYANSGGIVLSFLRAIFTEKQGGRFASLFFSTADVMCDGGRR